MDNDPLAKQSVEAEITSGNVPWEELVWVGSHHLVLPALYTAFSRKGILPLLPDDLAEHLSAVYTLNLNRNKHILEQCGELIRILNNEGIEPCFLKGAGYLLQGLYQDMGDRIMSDIDILIPAAEMRKAARVLYDNGYFHPDEFIKDDFTRHHHMPGFEHPDYVAMVELHHSIFPESFQKVLSGDEVHSEMKKIDGFRARILSTNHQQVLNFIHDQIVDENFIYRSILIKGLYDFYRLAILDSPEKTKPSVRGFEKKFNTYRFLASAAFNNSALIVYKRTSAALRFKRQFDFLLNHPEFYSFYKLMVLYSVRLRIILEVFITAPFSKNARSYIRKKIGSLDTAKAYLRKLYKGE